MKSRGTASSAISHNSEESLDELAALALSANADVVERVTQSRPVPDAATLVGSGKVQELSAMVKALAADLAIVDYDLTPTQQRNLEKAFDTKVIDRTQLILDIFARRARTREGRLQVELAQLRYLLPRLTGHGAGMSRLGGGIGTRGPGETKLETDRRRIHQRIRKIAQELESVRAGRAVHRAQRQSVPLATVALVGYTNAGKSTLFNRLTTAGVLADARMFATLDPTVRALVLPSRRKVLVSDTVGFIRNLPTTLVKAFRATLEEVTEATLLLHIIDISSPFASAQAALVRGVLAEIGAESIPQLLVLNKIDLLPESAAAAETARRLSGEAGIAEETPAVPIAARTGQGMDRLLAVIDRILPFDPVVHVRFRFPPAQAGKVSLLHDRGKVLDIHYSDAGCEVEAEVPESLRGKLESFLIRR